MYQPTSEKLDLDVEWRRAYWWWYTLSPFTQACYAAAMGHNLDANPFVLYTAAYKKFGPDANIQTDIPDAQ